MRKCEGCSVGNNYRVTDAVVIGGIARSSGDVENPDTIWERQQTGIHISANRLTINAEQPVRTRSVRRRCHLSTDLETLDSKVVQMQLDGGRSCNIHYVRCLGW